MKGIEFIGTILPTNKTIVPVGFLHKDSKEEVYPFYIEVTVLSSSFDEAEIILIPKIDQDMTKKKSTVQCLSQK